MSQSPNPVYGVVADVLILALLAFILIVLDAPTWGWVGLCAIAWLSLKTQDRVIGLERRS